MIKKIVLKINGMHCASCAMDIDGELEDASGVFESNTHYAKGQTEVKFDDTMVTDKKIQGIIEKIGYSSSLTDGKN